MFKETKVLKTHRVCCGPAARAESSSACARSFVVVGGGGGSQAHIILCASAPDKIKESPGLKGCLANLQQLVLLLAELMEKRAAQASRDLRPDYPFCGSPLDKSNASFYIRREGWHFFRSCADRIGIHSRFNIFFGPASLTVMEKDELAAEAGAG